MKFAGTVRYNVVSDAEQRQTDAPMQLRPAVPVAVHLGPSHPAFPLTVMSSLP